MAEKRSQNGQPSRWLDGPGAEGLYPEFLTWDGVAGEPIQRVLSCLNGLNETELREFFNLTSMDLARLTPAELLCGERERQVALAQWHPTLLELPAAVRLDMVAGAATRFRSLVFQQLEAMVGAAGDTEKRKLLSIRRAGEHLIERTTEAFGQTRDAEALAILRNLRRYREEIEQFISVAQNEADPTVHFN